MPDILLNGMRLGLENPSTEYSPPVDLITATQILFGAAPESPGVPARHDSGFSA